MKKQSQISWLLPNELLIYCQTCDNLHSDINIFVEIINQNSGTPLNSPAMPGNVGNRGDKKYNMTSVVHNYGKEGNILLSPHINF